MVNADQTVALSASILALLALISVSMFVCMFLIYWRYRSNEKRKTRWTDSPSQLRTGWLATDREILVPGQFSAKIVQPQMPNTSDTSEDLITESSDSQKSSLDEWGSCGKIFFILRYLVEREELMVRLVQLEGFQNADDIYSADSAYVDVQLRHIGSDDAKEGINPPKLDIALQQVYYFIISQDQLFSYKLVFKVNTFDDAFRRTVSGEVEVDLFEELKRHMFTGTEVILSKDIRPCSQSQSNCGSGKENVHKQADGTVKDENEANELQRSPIASPLSWDDQCDVSSKSSGLVPYEDLSSSGVQWHRLSGDSWEENMSMNWPKLSDSVVSVPNSFQFNRTVVDIDLEDGMYDDGLKVETDFRLTRRSISESYIPHYGRLSPPPKNFYHLVPSLVTKQRFGNESPFFTNKKNDTWNTSPNRLESSFTYDHTEHPKVERKRSRSLPSLSDPRAKDDSSTVYHDSMTQTSQARKRAKATASHRD